MQTYARLLRLALLGAALLHAGADAGLAQADLVVVSWNVESGDASPTALASRIAAFQGVDLWGFSEVAASSWLASFETAAEDGESADFGRVLGTTGGTDRLGIVFDADRFELVRSFELAALNIGGSLRAPLVAELRARETGTAFLFMVNHLARGNVASRHQQGTLLNQWARQQTLPVVAVGDYNFDWSVANGESSHDAGFDNMTADGVFAWVRPATLVRTQCSEGTVASGGAVLDFVFAAHDARGWESRSTIEVAPGDCPDPGGQQSDHRPVRAEFRTRPEAPQVTREELLRRIDALEQQIRELRELVERLPVE